MLADIRCGPTNLTLKCFSFLQANIGEGHKIQDVGSPKLHAQRQLFLLWCVHACVHVRVCSVCVGSCVRALLWCRPLQPPPFEHVHEHLYNHSSIALVASSMQILYAWIHFANLFWGPCLAIGIRSINCGVSGLSQMQMAQKTHTSPRAWIFHLSFLSANLQSVIHV